MRWNVEGADSQTGQDRVLAVEALDRADAERKARQHGILVSSIYPTSIRSAVEKIDEAVDAAEDQITAPLHSDVAAPRQPIPSYFVQAPARQIPEYRGLQIGSTVLMVFAVMYYLFAACIILVAILAAAGTALTSDTPLAAVGPFLLLVWGLALAMGGGIMHALSAACLALRDIARNSFR
jgi:hypothetical protein